MKIEIRRDAPSGASVAAPIERTVPSAGETMVSGPCAACRSGSRKKEIRNAVGTARAKAQIAWPVAAAATVRAREGRMNFHPPPGSGNFSGGPLRDGFGRSPPCDLSGPASPSSSASLRSLRPERAATCRRAPEGDAHGPGGRHGGGGTPRRLPTETPSGFAWARTSFFVFREWEKGRPQLKSSEPGAGVQGSSVASATAFLTLSAGRCFLERQNHRERVLPILVVRLSAIRLAKAVRAIELPCRQVRHAHFQGHRRRPDALPTGQGVLEEPAAVAPVSQARIRRDLVDVELFVERYGEEVPADARLRVPGSDEDAGISIRFLELRREKLSLPRHQKRLALDAGDLVQITRPRGSDG